ncbi:hypothetical protein C8A03DRAFT_33763 [Achaetomium macrosporum]|uniref:Uncharacterized protein n=1 Tax=Achaetomium macrosporum TaxID=79813 RepID=A0AAN7CC31_9PEZI|nr:hypothetical protein C8A03DRAFT_33763 [Achaetomium macrosporum]
MSLARAFTTRRVKQSLQAAEDAPHRSNSLKGSVGSIRHKISSPVELIHTTNMLSYNAPNIHPMSATSTGSSQRSDDDMSDSALTNGTTPPTSPDVESSPKRSLSPEPKHLSSVFTVSVQAPAPPAKSELPVIPQRSVSHSKKPYNTLVRQRSASALSQQSQQSQRTISTKASFTFSRSSSTSTSTSVTSHNSSPALHKSKLSNTANGAPAPASFSPVSAPRPQPLHQQQHRKEYGESKHPFGPELAQVSELAEEYGVKEQVVNVVDVEEQEMLAKGLLKISADEYLSEIRSLFATFFVVPRPVATNWI